MIDRDTLIANIVKAEGKDIKWSVFMGGDWGNDGYDPYGQRWNV